MANLLIICKQNGMIRDHWITGWKDAWYYMVHHIQNPIVDKQVIHQKLKIFKKQTNKTSRNQASLSAAVSINYLEIILPYLFHKQSLV